MKSKCTVALNCMQAAKGPLRADLCRDTKVLLALFHFHDFAAFVIATLRAGAMRHLLPVAVRALGERVSREVIVCATVRGTGFRVSPFWIRHCSSSTSVRKSSNLKIVPRSPRLREYYSLFSLSRRLPRAFQRGSGRTSSQRHSPEFKLRPQEGHSPLQFSWHRTR